MFYKWLIEKGLSNNKKIIEDKNSHIDYLNLDNKASIIANFLKNNGVSCGDRVIIINHNDIFTVEVIMACLRNGYVFVILHDKIENELLQNIINDCNPIYVIGKENDVKKYDKCVTQLMILNNNISYKSNKERILIPFDNLCYLMYTSGSTSTPKGVMAGYNQVKFCIEGINERINNSEKDHIFCCLPLSFDYGLYQVFMCLKYGAELVLRDKYIVQSLPSILKNKNITGFPVVPTLIKLLLKTHLLKKDSLPNLKYITSTGDDLSVSTIKEIEELFPKIRVIPMYGLTECKRATIMPDGRHDKIMLGSCGIPLRNTHVYLDNKDSNGYGELIVVGSNVMLGYWNAPELTKKYFGIDSSTGERFLRTGDIFSIDDEGFLYFIGRKNRIIKCNGYRIGNVEIEKKIENIDTVIEVYVFGYKDKLMGERIVACVYSKDKNIKEKIRKECCKWPNYMRIHELKIYKEGLPKNLNGKIDEKILRKDVFDDII